MFIYHRRETKHITRFTSVIHILFNVTGNKTTSQKVVDFDQSLADITSLLLMHASDELYMYECQSKSIEHYKFK